MIEQENDGARKSNISSGMLTHFFKISCQSILLPIYSLANSFSCQFILRPIHSPANLLSCQSILRPIYSLANSCSC